MSFASLSNAIYYCYTYSIPSPIYSLSSFTGLSILIRCWSINSQPSLAYTLLHLFGLFTPIIPLSVYLFFSLNISNVFSSSNSPSTEHRLMQSPDSCFSSTPCDNTTSPYRPDYVFLSPDYICSLPSHPPSVTCHFDSASTIVPYVPNHIPLHHSVSFIVVAATLCGSQR